MNLKDIISFIGSLAFTSALLAVSVFIINYKYKDFFKHFFKGKFSHLKLHEIFGIAAIFLGTVHGIGMLLAYPSVLKTHTGLSGLLLLILFWVLGALPFLVKKVPVKYKKIFFKSHKILGVLIFIFILIHIFV